MSVTGIGLYKDDSTQTTNIRNHITKNEKRINYKS